MNWLDNSLRFALLLTMATLAACGSSPVYKGESFNPESPFQYLVSAEVDQACEAARRALLSNGYETQVVALGQLKASKAFQPDSDTHAVIEFNVTCAMRRGGAAIYANALEKRYQLKKTSQSAGLSVPSVGSISLPWGGATESLVLVSSKTISDPNFYKRFYGLVDRELGPQPKSK